MLVFSHSRKKITKFKHRYGNKKYCQIYLSVLTIFRWKNKMSAFTMYNIATAYLITNLNLSKRLWFLFYYICMCCMVISWLIKCWIFSKMFSCLFSFYFLEKSLNQQRQCEALAKQEADLKSGVLMYLK